MSLNMLKLIAKKRIANWFLFAWQLPKLKKILPKPDVIIYSSPSLVGYLGAEKLSRTLNVPLAFEVRDIWPLTLTVICLISFLMS